MKRILKIFLIGIISLILLFGGLAFYAYKKLSPEEIKKMTIASFDGSFENAKTELAEVTLDFGFIFNVGFKGLKVENDKADLFSIKEIKAHVPFYAVLFGAGAVDLEINGMKINYLETPKGNNWEMKKAQSSKEGTSYAFLLAKTKINVKIRDLDIFYALKTGKNGEVLLQEADFYNLNFLSKTKYSLISLIKSENYSFLAKGEGDIDLEKYWSEKLIQGTSSIKTSEFKSKMIPGKIPDLKTDLTFTYDSSGKISSDIQTYLGKEKIFDSKLSYYQGVSTFDPMRLNIPMEKIIPEYGQFSFKGNKLEASGKFKMMETEMIPDLSFNWDAGPILKDYQSSTKLTGKLKNNFLEMEIKANILEGTARIGLSGKINYEDPKKMGPFKMDVLLKNLKIKGPPPEKPATKGSGAPQKSKDGMALVPSNINLTLENVSLADIPVSGKGTIILGENYLKIPKMVVSLGGGKGDFSTSVYFKKEKKEGDFNVGFNGIDLKVFNPYFPKGVGAVTGTLFGKFSGGFEQGEKDVIISNGLFDLEARDGKIKEFNMEKHILKVFEIVPFLTASKKDDVGTWVTGDFQSVQLIGKINNEQVIMDKIHFLGINKKIEIKGKGEINKTKNSQVDIDFIDHKGTISGPLKKYTGTDVLKFRFKGTGYDLKPDYSFTVNSLGKGLINAIPVDLEEAGKKFFNKIFKK